MASSHAPSSQKRLATYGGGSSRKRSLNARIDHNLEQGISSTSKLEHPVCRTESPRPRDSNQSPRPQESYNESSRTAGMSTFNPSCSSPSYSSSSQDVPVRKRHSVAFAPDNFKDRTHCRSLQTQPLASSESLTRRTSNPKPAASESVKRTSTPSRKPRLIDALAAQKAALTTADADTDYDEAEPDHCKSPERKSGKMPQNLSSNGVCARPPDRRGTTPTNRKVRFTYRQSRTIASESKTPENFHKSRRTIEDDLDSLIVESHPDSTALRDAFALDDLEDDQSTQPAIKSVHELRRAGANHRFSDEMNDLLYRIGVPSTGDVSTMRSNALCELVQKLQRNDFLRHFRDHASRDTVVRDVGKEMDPICGFALIAAMICFLHSGPAPNLLRQLTNDGVGKLLARLLFMDEDIEVMAIQKEPHMSRMSRSSLGEVKTILQQLPIWHGYNPASISPRTAALQLMALLSGCADAALLDHILLGSQQAIIAVATWASEQGSFDDIDYALTVFTLQTQSSAGLSSRLNTDGGHPTRISRLLLRAIQRWPSGRTELQSALLKLALNTTNTEDEAAAFDDPQLSARLAMCISDLFAIVHTTIELGKLENEKYDELLLMLGVMINIMEHCSRARRSVNEDALGKLMALWQDNQQSVGEADSVNKSKLSVAVGYLSVLLGYMCLAGQARKLFDDRVGRNALRRLRISIQQFAHLYKAVDSKAHAMDALVDELTRIE